MMNISPKNDSTPLLALAHHDLEPSLRPQIGFAALQVLFQTHHSVDVFFFHDGIKLFEYLPPPKVLGRGGLGG